MRKVLRFYSSKHLKSSSLTRMGAHDSNTNTIIDGTLACRAENSLAAGARADGCGAARPPDTKIFEQGGVFA